MKKLVLLLLVFLPVFAIAQQDPGQLQFRIEKLERDLNVLQGEYYRNRSGNSNVSINDVSDDDAKKLLQQQQQFQAAIELRLSQIDDQLRQVNGKLEEQEFANNKLKEDLRKLNEDMNFRLAALEKDKAAAQKEADKGDGSKQLGTVVIDPNKQEFVKGKEAQKKDLGDPKKRYDEAFDLFRQSKYSEAEKALRAYIRDFPKEENVGSAYFWLGETYYARKDYEPASVEYLKGYRKAPTGPKAPDSLLKLALSLAGTKKHTEACTVLEKLNKEFPHAAAPIRRKAEVERTKLRCGR